MATRALNAQPTAPRPLATPTDLGPDDVRAVVGAVNPLIADSLALYVKTKNFHWHVSGPHFRDYHLLFDEQAEVVLESVDILAERLRKIGGSTIRSIGHVASLQNIADDEEEYVTPLEMVRRLLDDNRAMAERQRAAIETCDDHHDTPTGNLLQDILDQTERRVWFLFEVSQTGEPSSESEESRASQSRGADAEGPEPRGSESRRPTSRASEPRSSGSRATPRNRPPGGRSGRR
jgi:starvation-inducible DNA-binding protein